MLRRFKDFVESSFYKKFEKRINFQNAKLLLNSENATTIKDELINYFKNNETDIEFYIHLLLYTSKFSLKARKFYPTLISAILLNFPSYINIIRDILDNTNSFISNYFQITKSFPSSITQNIDQHLKNLPSSFQLDYLFNNCLHNTLPYYIRTDDINSYIYYRYKHVYSIL